MKTLLVSENKQDWEILRRIFKNLYKDLEFICATNKEEAFNYAASDGPFGFFIVDAELKNADPEEISQSLIDLAGDRPFIFIGQEAFITDRIGQDLYQSNEYNEQVLKPLDRDDIADDIKMKVGNVLSWAKKEEFESSIEEVDPEDFIPMKIKSFFLYNVFPYDIYLEITKTQYIKILSANKPYTLSTLSTYAKKNIKFLHIKKDDQLKYLEEESIKCLKALKKSSPANTDTFIILLRSITILHQYMISLGVTPTILTLSNVITDTIIDVAKHYKSLKDLLKIYPNLYEGIASKSLLTGFISEYICRAKNWDSITTKKKLTISSLLQDYSLPDEKLSKINYLSDPRLQDFSEEKIKQFHKHPLVVAEVARQFTMYPDIDYIIEHHHELPNKKGFPNHPTATKITAICGVFNTAQFFAAEIDGKKLSSEVIQKALRTMNRDFNSGNFKEPYLILKKALL